MRREKGDHVTEGPKAPPPVFLDSDNKHTPCTFNSFYRFLKYLFGHEDTHRLPGINDWRLPGQGVFFLQNSLPPKCTGMPCAGRTG
ncbi:hypothetical protein AVEN_5885-1 [Araneus ventricosus]|uniref:Uncharacterized protein n=1 Tax=Araneus ventricosus TaxID=182803 RepID=A0A4Y2JT56_ARAVE|nr:hypothetical protein AVEN_5885-1 [Araneus ventricosus]